MRQSLKELIDSTIIYQYSIPHVDKKIDGIDLCNYEDDCYDYSSDENLVELIYNSIIEYSFNEFEMTEYDYSRSLSDSCYFEQKVVLLSSNSVATGDIRRLLIKKNFLLVESSSNRLF